jgi:uncharacterized membrane protein
MPWLDWASLFVRWFHVIAGVAWIGASFYFIWLDNSLREPPSWKKEKGIKGDLWAVHGGGFYEVAKYQYGPEVIPEKLHWFKWEAYSTWLSGAALLIIVYYFGASAYLIDPSVKSMSPATAIALGVGFIVIGFSIYEAGCRSPLSKNTALFSVFLFLFISIACFLATQWFSGRGAYIHVGALIGTIMVANVAMVIMPSQRKMVNAVSHKKTINPAWGEGAKLRSVHNNYFTLPLLFIMISNHYPMTYQHQLNWLILIAIIALSAWIRHYFNLKHQGVKKPLILVSGAIGMALLALWVSLPASNALEARAIDAKPVEQKAASQQLVTQQPIPQQTVMKLIQTHCMGCHSKQPSDDMFTVAPLGVVLDSWQDIERQKAQIVYRTTVTRDMPFLNKTNMTEQERVVLAQWGKQ